MGHTSAHNSIVSSCSPSSFPNTMAGEQTLATTPMWATPMKKMVMRKVMKKKKVTKSKIARGRFAKVAVFKGKKEKTIGGLTSESLMRNKRGKIVSKKRNAMGKRASRTWRLGLKPSCRRARCCVLKGSMLSMAKLCRERLCITRQRRCGQRMKHAKLQQLQAS